MTTAAAVRLWLALTKRMMRQPVDSAAYARNAAYLGELQRAFPRLTMQDAADVLLREVK